MREEVGEVVHQGQYSLRACQVLEEGEDLAGEVQIRLPVVVALAALEAAVAYCLEAAFQDGVNLEEVVALVACQAVLVGEVEVDHGAFHLFLLVPMLIMV